MGDPVALDDLPDAVVVVDADGRVRAVNDRARALLGLGTHHVGARLDVLLPPTTAHGEPSTHLPPERGRRTPERTLGVTVADGHVRTVAQTGRGTSDGGAVLTYRNAARREALLAARSDLIATVSHELRSPLTSVKGFVGTLLSRWDLLSDDLKRTMLQTMEADADRVTRLLTELLDVARIDADRLQLHPTTISPAELVTDIVHKAAHRPVGIGRDVRVELADDLPPGVLADRDKVEQVVTNLLENALRYTDAVVTVGLLVDDGDVLVTVTDEGPGIAPDQQRRIFAKFGRGRDARRSGTGLGLFIARGLARAHGGDVSVTSTPGEGATFTLRLPSAPAGARSEQG